MTEPKTIPPTDPRPRVQFSAEEIGFTLKDDGGDEAGTDGSVDGWIYVGNPEGGDCRKFVTLVQDGMMWVGIRAYNQQGGFWQITMSQSVRL